MKLTVKRIENFAEETRGELFIDGVFECYTLEDQHRDIKVKGDTRIPAGTYPIVLRTEGGHHAKYLAKYGPTFHKGMLHITNVPNFQWILIHKGNTELDTAGCLLVGRGKGLVKGKNAVVQSSKAYAALYPKVAAAILRGEAVTIQYINQ